MRVFGYINLEIPISMDLKTGVSNLIYEMEGKVLGWRPAHGRGESQEPLRLDPFPTLLIEQDWLSLLLASTTLSMLYR